MSLLLFAQNLLETAESVVVNPGAATDRPVTRLYDRDRGPQYEGGAVGQTDIDVDLGAPGTASAWAFVNHNLAGVTVQLFADDTFPPTTVRDAFAASGADVLREFPAIARRYWRIRVPAMAVAPKIGELLLGQPRAIGLNPFYRDSGVHTLANVARDRSPGGYSWAVRKGDKRVRLPYRWRTLGAADLAALVAAYDEVDQGAKKLLLRDSDGTLRWVDWISDTVAPVPVGGGLVEVDATFEESL